MSFLVFRTRAQRRCLDADIKFRRWKCNESCMLLTYWSHLTWRTLSPGVCTRSSMKNRWELSSYLCWQGLLSVFTGLFAHRSILVCVRMQSCREDPRLSVSVSVCDYICVCVRSCKGTGRFLRRHGFLFFPPPPPKKRDTKGWILCVRTWEYIHSWLWTNINNLWTHMQIWWHSHRNTQCSSATQQTKRCEISQLESFGISAALLRRES